MKTIAENSDILKYCLHICAVSGLLFIYSRVAGAVNENNLYIICIKYSSKMPRSKHMTFLIHKKLK